MDLLKFLAPIAFVHAIGHVMSNIFVVCVRRSFPLMIKAIEPFVTAANFPSAMAIIAPSCYRCTNDNTKTVYQLFGYVNNLDKNKNNLTSSLLHKNNHPSSPYHIFSDHPPENGKQLPIISTNTISTKTTRKTNHKFKKNIPISLIISKKSIRLSSSNQNTPPPVPIQAPPPVPIQAQTHLCSPTIGTYSSPFMQHVRRFATEFGNQVVKGSLTLVFAVGFSFLLPFLYRFKQFKPVIFLRDNKVVVFDENNRYFIICFLNNLF